jgi:hydroxymethylpyrimidine/phosphomethylpyrimidine kinase
VSGCPHATALLLFPGNNSSSYWIGGQAGLTADLDTIEKTDMSALHVIELQFLSNSAHIIFIILSYLQRKLDSIPDTVQCATEPIDVE